MCSRLALALVSPSSRCRLAKGRGLSRRLSVMRGHPTLGDILALGPAESLSSGGRFCSSGSTWYRTEPRSDGNPPPSYGDRDLHHGPAGDRCLQLEIAVSSRGWLESPSPFLLYVLTKTFRDVYTYISQPNVVVKWASHPSAVS